MVDGDDHSSDAGLPFPCADEVPHNTGESMTAFPRGSLIHPRITHHNYRDVCVCAGAAQGPRCNCLLPGAGQPGTPGLLPAAGPALARPHGAPASGGVRCRERDEERRCSCYHQPVQSQMISAFGSSSLQRYRTGKGCSANKPG